MSNHQNKNISLSKDDISIHENNTPLNLTQFSN